MAGKTSFLYVKMPLATTPVYDTAAMQNDAGRISSLTAGLLAPDACVSMAQLRQAIDVLDARLVALLAVRQAYIERAAALKTGRDQVRDPARIEDVVTKVLTAARSAGLSPAIAEPVWRTLIEASIVHEFEKFDGR
jgi:isochorismate pyruvate lyase